MKMDWRDLFTYSFISPLHLLLSLSNSTVEGPRYRGIGRDGYTPLHTQKHTLLKTLFPININNSFSSSLFSIDHLALSSINLQNALFKLLINTLIDLQKCHHTLRQEVLMVVSPQRFSSPQSGSDECQNECVHYSVPGEADGFWVEVFKWTSKVLITKGKCYLPAWPKQTPVKYAIEEHYSTLLLQSVLVWF